MRPDDGEHPPEQATRVRVLMTVPAVLLVVLMTVPVLARFVVVLAMIMAVLFITVLVVTVIFVTKLFVIMTVVLFVRVIRRHLALAVVIAHACQHARPAEPGRVAATTADRQEQRWPCAAVVAASLARRCCAGQGVTEVAGGGRSRRR